MGFEVRVVALESGGVGSVWLVFPLEPLFEQLVVGLSSTVMHPAKKRTAKQRRKSRRCFLVIMVSPLNLLKSFEFQ